ncbi:pygopus homolog 1-like [Ptychodera flava]|uniref:pygopus homolog 1-like n=1 Tax=Ptychodera flava TaxID=63121 RepID=UPI003969C815
MPRERRLPKRFRSSDDSDQEGSGSVEKKTVSGSQPASPSKKKKKANNKQVQGKSPSELVAPSKIKSESHATKKSVKEGHIKPMPSSSQTIMNPRATVNSYPPSNYGNINNYNQQQSHPSPMTNVNHTGFHGNVPLQPVILNPNDPAAPAIYPCGLCHREVHDNDDAILCESSCNFWFHRVCTGMTEAAYTLLTAEQSAEWVCDKCIAKKKTPMVRIKKLNIPEIRT